MSALPAQATPDYFIAIKFDSINFWLIDDCEMLWQDCNQAEVYGSFTAQSIDPSGNTRTVRSKNFGKWVDTAYQTDWRSDSRTSHKRVRQGQTHTISSTWLCTSFYPGSNCDSVDYVRDGSTSTVFLSVRAGDRIRLAMDIRDDDNRAVSIPGDPDDHLCDRSFTKTFSDSELQTLDEDTYMDSVENADGKCRLYYQIYNVFA